MLSSHQPRHAFSSLYSKPRKGHKLQGKAITLAHTSDLDDTRRKTISTLSMKRETFGSKSVNNGSLRHTVDSLQGLHRLVEMRTFPIGCTFFALHRVIKSAFHLVLESRECCGSPAPPPPPSPACCLEQRPACWVLCWHIRGDS